MHRGYIKLYRKILSNPLVCKDAEYFTVWVFLLLSATHTERDVENCGETKTLAAGQVITGAQAIAEKFKISESKVKRILKRFESDRLIEQKTYPRKGRIVTILNWSLYQENERLNERNLNECRTINGRLMDGNNNENKLKNENNGNNIPPLPPEGKSKAAVKKFDAEALISDFTSDVELKEALRDFVAMRKSIRKPITTERALNGVLKKLSELSTNPAEQVELVNTAVERNWLTVYKLQETNENTRSGDNLTPVQRMQQETLRRVLSENV